MSSRSLVEVHNEWDPLEEMIVGHAVNARVPSPDRGLFAVDYADLYEKASDIPSGPYDQQVIEETTEDLDAFVKVLESQGVVVRRPDVSDHAARYGTPDWSADGEYNYCPRDVLLPIGNTIIETPMTLRTRYFEPFAYRSILLDYFDSGANWISAPKPRLLDETYNLRPSDGQILNNHEPIFDAANVLRVGRHVLYLVSSSGNMLGLRWLQRVLGDRYEVQPLIGLYDGTHVDTTIALIRPGLVVLNSDRVRPDQVPDLFKSWDVIWCPSVPDPEPASRKLRASTWIGMNLIMINPGLAVVEATYRPLITALERHGVQVIPLPLRHARVLSGGLHCVSLDVRRRGSLEDHS
ncbi:scyllo-inosamine-4-phosphate amidinotransferase [Micromonospora sp. NPDC000663]|uniref:scyllo-inosamine-4-phosphate amidinotransferase n=1 Tax=Micromonospora sp. NPDC000663 TaxID=3364218 RepID=UPI00368BFF64